MKIIHNIDKFLFTIFPDLNDGDEKLIIETFTKYYTYGPYIPKVTIDKNLVTIEIDTPTINSQEADYRKVVGLSEKRKYQEAIPILKNLIEQNPSNSEYHRILGQIHSDVGDQEEAINCLIDSLRWNSKNGNALLMMGNIFAKFKNDVLTAMKYYDQALVANVNDHISLTNIGYLLLQQNKLDDAKKYFLEALKINDQYPNAHFSLGLITEKENDLQSAFYSTIQAIKFNKNRDTLYQKSVKYAFELAGKIMDTGIGKKIYLEYKHKLEFDGGTEIDIVEDNEIQTSAKIEFAENYDRAKHIVRFKPNHSAIEHLIMHELVHLDLVIEARKNDLNQLFISTQDHKANFIKNLEPTIKKFQRMGISENGINAYCNGIFSGLNLQAYNTPIDLFIENFIYNEHPELRPYQFISLYSMIQEGIKAVTEKKIVDLSPQDILSKSKIYNLVNAIQFKELYGLDFLEDFRASQGELNQAKKFYDEFLEYKEDRQPAEEYELVLHWAEDLKLDKNFELINEKTFRSKRIDIDTLLSAIEEDPYGLESKDPYEEREMEKFQKSQEKIGTNMAVVMFMVDALQFFKSKQKDEIKKIAFEIATLGIQGYSPEKKDYRINAIPGKLFSGYHIMAYYYVSWMLAMPEMVPQLNLPFDDEYKMAVKMNKPE